MPRDGYRAIAMMTNSFVVGALQIDKRLVAINKKSVEFFIIHL
ncbi:hypothetical protein ES288_D13G243000v1 [Gossypium darwinii]|uniref:Uncharacterized protein n=1 Tax=Gossypium darwinii TaxID=34276 RepID=A0A5D2A1F6_GOSDA|nr:hypothetical protein ES288_D13G243000v1 [Gossypium darwinii]